METSTDESNIVKNRQMGYLSCTSFVVGNIIGSGIFITPGVIYAYVNSVGLSFIVWILCAAVSLLGALVYVELGTGILESGCDYSYICYVKWIPPGFAFMFVGALLSFPASNAVQATTFSRYLIEGISPLYIVPSPYDIICERLIATAVLVFLVWLNFHSLGGFVAKFQIVATVAKLLSLALVILGGLYYLIFKGMTQHLENPFDGSKWNVSDLMLGMYAGLWTLAGWDVLNYGAPEIRNPKRNMPLALISGIFTVTAIYILVNLAFFVVLDSQSLKDSNAIAARFSQQAFGDFSFIVPFLIVILLVGTMNGLMFCSSRYMYAAAKRGHLPAYLTCINERTGSPRAAVFTQVTEQLNFQA
ncbi:hypothetical protein AB6A40_004265 [Gnathostoma spinigerum]|uniref:Uncharacterized protein n=1 Tax=Gnathostoma spinigerum TaxID=75299 RepID=A0ABD6ED20_9BILA